MTPLQAHFWLAAKDDILVDCASIRSLYCARPKKRSAREKHAPWLLGKMLRCDFSSCSDIGEHCGFWQKPTSPMVSDVLEHIQVGTLHSSVLK